MADVHHMTAEKLVTGDSGSDKEMAGPNEAHSRLLNEAFGSSATESRVSSSAGRPESQQALSEALLNKGIMPVVNEKDVSQTLSKAAAAMAGKDLGVSSDGGKSSGTSVSRLLQAVGADVRQTGHIPDLKSQLEKLGWESNPFGAGPLKPGDIVFTEMQNNGRNVGVVGENGKIIYSHSFRGNRLEGHESWNSKFTTVMRGKGSK